MHSQKLSIPVEEYTTPNLASIAPDDALSTVKEMMDENKIRHVVVQKDNKVVGIISDRDMRGLIPLSNFPEMKARDAMIDEPFMVYTGTSLQDVVFEMSQHKWGSAVVLEKNDDLYGVFTTTDALNALVEVLRGADIESMKVSN